MLDRSVAPKASLLKDLALSEVEISTLDNEIELHAFRDSTNPVIKIDIVFPFGKKQESVNGSSTVCTRLMTDATLSYSSEELQETLDQYGAHLDISADYDDTTISLLCLKEHLSVLLPLLKSIITEPLFDSKELESIKSQLIQKIRVNNSKNCVISSKSLRSLLLNGSPYALYAEEQDINSLKVQVIQQFFERYYKITPTIVVAGDVDDQALKSINKIFGNISFDASPEKPDFSLEPKLGIETIRKEGSVQASIRLGTLSIPKGHPDYFHLNIANEILGGYFGSRLMKNVREEKGYTYGIYSSLINYQEVDFQLIGADVQIDSVDDAIDECFKELSIMQEELVSDEEMTTIKNYMLGKLASNLDNIFSQADNYKANLSNEIDFHSYCKSYVQAIRNVNASDIQEVSKKYFSQEFLTVKVY